MLNTALRNGRQLVLSEGGRMLLHETNRGSNVKHSTNGSINNSLRNSAISLPHPSTNQTTLNSSPQKIRMNVIKQKESSSSASSAGGVTKNKVCYSQVLASRQQTFIIRIYIYIFKQNIRIISLTDFKKLCDQPKSLQKIPGTLAR